MSDRRNAEGPGHRIERIAEQLQQLGHIVSRMFEERDGSIQSIEWSLEDVRSDIVDLIINHGTEDKAEQTQAADMLTLCTFPPEVKSKWGIGPWDDEPDLASYTEPETGYRCQMVRNTFGVWCGYVEIPPSHPVYKQKDLPIKVYSADMCDSGQGTGVRMIGFDCGHFSDLVPETFGRMRNAEEAEETMKRCGMTYKDMAFVRAELKKICLQLKALELGTK